VRWGNLNAIERRALFPALWRLLFVRLALAGLGVARTQRILGRWAPAGTGVLESPDVWKSRAFTVRRVAARIPGARCVARSLVLWWWMRARGLDPQLLMGVRSGERGVEGHAWIECDGHLLDETAESVASYQGIGWRSPN
jgi:hypothetical protein